MIARELTRISSSWFLCLLSCLFVAEVSAWSTLDDWATVVASQVETQRQPLVVLIDLSGNYYVGNSALVRSDLASLKEAIRQQAGTDIERTIVIQADAKTSHQSVITAMDAIGQLGFSKLSIATTPEKQDER